MKSIHITGPFFTSYSYAKVNRGLALELSKVQDEYSVTLYGDSDKIDYLPSKSELKRITDKSLSKLISEPSGIPDVVIYHNFPKDPADLHGLKDLIGKVKIGIFPWEESIYPKRWVDEINDNLDGVLTISTYVADILKSSGIKIPIRVIPLGIDSEMIKDSPNIYKLSTKKKYKFLNISSAKKRKGLDILIKAYFEEFNIHDDVTLIIKSFPNPDNNLNEIIQSIQTPDSPEIILIEDPSLTEDQLASLHKQADCEVYPTRAEGFGLPILEAMYFEKPVIVTGYSGQMDFCNEDNSFLLDYTVEYSKESEFVNTGARWAEPSKDSLKRLLRKVYEGEEKKEIDSKIKNAKKTSADFTWKNSAKIAFEFLKDIEATRECKNSNLAIITPINDETGIAEYSQKLFSELETSFNKIFYLANKDIADRKRVDDSNVIRNWESGEENFREALDFIVKNDIEFIHIQYHSGSFFSTQSLNNLIENLYSLRKKIFITFHAFRSNSFDYLKEVENLHKVNKIFIHNKNDYEYAKTILNNLELFILPTERMKKRDKKNLRKQLGIKEEDIIIASHGLMNTNKNIPEIIQAIGDLHNEDNNIKFFSINAVSPNNIHSETIFKECEKIVKNLNISDSVFFFREFLSNSEIEILLKVSDLIIFNYTEVGESASASVRKALSSENPVITTDINMFSDLDECVFKIKKSDKQSVVSGVKNLLEDKNLQEKIVKNSRRFISDNEYSKKAIHTLKIYCEFI